VILVLDAHALLWWLRRDPGLDPTAQASISDSINDVIVSASTIWEIEIKRALGRLDAPDGLVDAIQAAGFEELPVTGRDAEDAARLPPHHKDPFDRMLIAQAQRLDAFVVSRDAAFAAYELNVLRA
jgi:PIN domain nuclease of toxin-antitoxin system